MKSITNRLFLFAASALFLATAAYGQTTLRFEVPFGFRVADGAVTAGEYMINMEATGNWKTARLLNLTTHQSVLSVGRRLSRNEETAPGTARIVFRCTDEACA